MRPLQIGAQQQLEAIADAADDAIISVSLGDLAILTWSRSSERIYEYSADDIIGRPLHVLLPRSRHNETELIEQTVVLGQRVEGLESEHLTHSGKPLRVSVNAAPLYDDSGQICGALLMVRDLTEHLRTRSELQVLQETAQHRSLVIETANRVALDILASRTGVEALRHIADAARVLAGARYAALGVARPSEDGQVLAEFVTVGLTPEDEAFIGSRPQGIGILGLLLRRTEPLRIDTLSDHPDSIGFPPNHPEMDSFLGVPIRRGDMVLGSLYLTNKQGGGAFTEADEIAVQALGAHAAVAIHHVHMLSRQRSLVNSLIAAQEEERRAVAYDLHDGLTQYVMASQAHLEAFRRAHSNGKAEKAERELKQGMQYLKEAVVESRRLINGLRSLALDDLGLAGALEQLVSEERERSGWEKAAFSHNLTDRRFDKTLETGAYRIVQEALTNVRKHAEATEVEVLLQLETDSRSQECLRLQVRDWGRGFDLENQALGPTHVGLHGMNERAVLLGGTLKLNSAPGQGSVVMANLPVPSAHASTESTATAPAVTPHIANTHSEALRPGIKNDGQR
ncbi:MAG TPA: GAF domain-containing protein [Abditibacteriaceae bacterium]|jgi:PAS domain S-box-containing protein